MSERKGKSGSGGGARKAGGRGDGKGRSGREGGRGTFVRVKTALGRKGSSTRWLQRQLNDPYVAEAQRLGYRSRAAFKLIELDDRFKLINTGDLVVDLGAAPGGWSQIAARRAGLGKGRVIALDLLPMDAVEGVECLQGDFLLPEVEEAVKVRIGGRAQLILSDMAAATTGHRPTDHIRTMALAEASFEFAAAVLAPGGAFVCKYFRGGGEQTLQTRIKQAFTSVRNAKPESSRAQSVESYLIATGFRLEDGAAP